MRFRIPRQSRDLADLAVVGLAQLRGCAEPSTSLVTNTRSSTCTVLLSINAASSEAISPEKFAWLAGNATST